MNAFALEMAPKTNRLHECLTTFADAYSKAIAFQQGASEEPQEQLQSLKNALFNADSMIAPAQLAVQGFRDSVLSLPRLTSSLNHAKRRVVQVLDDFDDAIESFLRFLRELRENLSDSGDGDKTQEID